MQDLSPVDGIRITGPAVVLRPVTEADAPALAALLPDDYELDPTVSAPSRPLQLIETFRRDRAAWTPRSWKLHLVAATPEGRIVGEQIVEGDDFTETRTVDSASWVAAADRSRGLGRAMRAAMLALAFEGLGARVAVTSAWHDNAASLAVSRALGYVEDHVEQHPRGDAADDLVHLRLDAEAWRSVPRRAVALTGVTAALASFGAGDASPARQCTQNSCTGRTMSA